MIKLEMELSDIDYEVLVKEILPKVADRLKQNGSPLAPIPRQGQTQHTPQLGKSAQRPLVARLRQSLHPAEHLRRLRNVHRY